MTPEAVVHRYLQIISTTPRKAEELALLLSADADLLARWLTLLHTPADFEVLLERLQAMPGVEFAALAEAQAWAELPVMTTARLSVDQWHNVLRSAFVAEVLATYFVQEAEQGSVIDDPRNVRLRALLAISGVQLHHDARLSQINEFRSINPALLEDAALELRIFAVIDALEVGRETELAQQLLHLSAAEFEPLLAQADLQARELIDGLEIDLHSDVDWGHRIWLRQQLHTAARAFDNCASWQEIGDAHERVSRPLFVRPPLIIHADAEGAHLRLLGDAEIGIAISSFTSSVAAAVRSGNTVHLRDGADLAVVDRQLLRALGAEEAFAVPVPQAEQKVLLLVDSDDDGDVAVLAELYAQELGACLARLERTRSESPEEDGEELLATFRASEYRRLREIVHEANNPLSIVHNYLHILEMRLRHEPEAAEQLALISSELRRAGEIFARARDIPQQTDAAHTAPADAADIDLKQWVEQVVELHRGYAADHEVTLDTDLPAQPVAVHTQADKLAQIIGNLLKNAIEACDEDDEVVVGARGGVYRDGRMGVEVFVRDSGPGLPAEVLSSLAAAKATRKGGEHQGIGLQVAFKLAAELDGAIDVRSQPEAGATFTLFLPAASEAISTPSSNR